MARPRGRCRCSRPRRSTSCRGCGSPPDGTLKYPYGFSWMGRPVIQLPEDMITVQEVIYRVKPDVVIETGIAHGGSLIFSASLCKAMGKGRVIGVDIDIRAHNRDSHRGARAVRPDRSRRGQLDRAGRSSSRSVSSIEPGETVLVILDSNHLEGPRGRRARGLCAAGDARLLHRGDRRRDAVADRCATR